MLWGHPGAGPPSSTRNGLESSWRNDWGESHAATVGARPPTKRPVFNRSHGADPVSKQPDFRWSCRLFASAHSPAHAMVMAQDAGNRPLTPQELVRRLGHHALDGWLKRLKPERRSLQKTRPTGDSITRGLVVDDLTQRRAAQLLERAGSQSPADAKPTVEPYISRQDAAALVRNPSMALVARRASNPTRARRSMLGLGTR
jgi:hypothetical protein